jgi:hypothetical protein
MFDAIRFVYLDYILKIQGRRKKRKQGRVKVVAKHQKNFSTKTDKDFEEQTTSVEVKPSVGPSEPQKGRGYFFFKYAYSCASNQTFV